MRNLGSRIASVSARCGRGAPYLIACATLLIGCVKPRDADEQAQAAPGYAHVETAHQLVTVVARDACLKDLLGEVARQNGVVIVSHDPLDERVTLEFRNLPLRKAMERVLRDRSFVWQSARAPAGANSLRKVRPSMLWVFSKGRRDRAEIASSNLALASEHVAARLDAISALADAGGDQVVAVITAAALSDGDASVREEAVDALADIGDETGIQGLEQALTDPEYHVRKAAVEALADIGGEASALALTVALKDRDVSLREEAVDALGEIGGQTAKRLLRQAAEDEDSSIREAAAEYLAELPVSSCPEVMICSAASPSHTR